MNISTPGISNLKLFLFANLFAVLLYCGFFSDISVESLEILNAALNFFGTGG